MLRLQHLGAACGLLALASLACSGKGSAPVTAEADLIGASSVHLSPGLTPDQLALPYELTLDPTTLEASLQPLPDRAGAAQGFVFDLDIANFLRPSNLVVRGVTRELNGNLSVHLRHSHPFPAVQPTAAAVGLNRADLGYTGKLLVLADGLHSTYFSGGITIDPNFVVGQDGFAEVGNLLATAGLINNAFPYKLLVDESRNNRVGVSNAGSMTGNYNPAIGGWQRSNLGTSNTGWTGYDYLHGGQATDVSIQIRASRLTGSVSVPLAILIKYTDPKGIGTGSKRIPPATPEVTRFAYRLPHSALDVSRISDMNIGLINNTAGSQATIQFRIRDWDTQAASAADTDLSDEANVALVLPGTAGYPTVDMSVPAFAGAPITILPSGGATGLPGDELPYLIDVTNSLGTAPPGEVIGLIRAIDKEDNVAAAQNIHFGVDPVTLAADPLRALQVRTYQTVHFVVQGSGVPPQILSVNPPGGVLGRGGDVVPFSAVASNSPTGWAWNFGGGATPNTPTVATPAVQLGTRGSYIGGVTASNAFGTSPNFPFSYDVLPYGWANTFGGSSTDGSTAVAGDNAGNVLVGGVFTSTVDFDPGPGTVSLTAVGGGSNAFLAKYTANGDLAWVRHWGEANAATIWDLVVDSANNVWALGRANGSFDADPGSGTTNAFLPAGGYYATRLNSSGTFVDVYSWDGSGASAQSTIVGTLGPADSLIVGGTFQNVLGFDLDPTFGTDSVIATAVSAFVVRLSSAGTYSWGRSYGNLLAVTTLRDLTVDGAGYLRIGGSWRDTTDFDPGGGLQNRTAVGSNDDAYLLTLDIDGLYQDVTTWGNGNEDAVHSVSSSGTNRLYVGGWTRGLSGVDIDPGAGTMTVTMSNTSQGGSYFVRYDATNPVPVFAQTDARVWDGTPGIRISTNNINGNAAIALTMTTSLDVDPGPGTITLTSANDPVTVVVDQNGDYLAHNFMNLGILTANQVAYGPSGEIFTAARYSGGPHDFDPTTFTDNRTSNGGADAYVIRFTGDLDWDF
ncbi:MAG: hypothetical protein GEEBNDBF_01056 [bacterium]|nr:hypothetical protein [bacterium]